MPITQALTNSFRTEIFQGLHNFSNPGGHTFKLALYTNSANLNANTSFYTTSGEVSGTGYAAGGVILTSITPVIAEGVVTLDFQDVTIASSTITARGAMIYNATSANRSVAIFDFGIDRSTNNAPFVIIFPSPTANGAVIRLSS